MKLLPYDSFVIQTADPLPKVVARLQAQVAAPPLFKWQVQGDPAYFGRVGETEFKIFPRIGYRNSFVPIVCGKLVDEKAGAVAYVRMRLHLSVVIFMAVWIAFVGSIFIGLAVPTIIERQSPIAILIVPAALLVFGTVLPCGAFWFEARHVRPRLTAILQGKKEIP
jgi:hypothetical protein